MRTAQGCECASQFQALLLLFPSQTHIAPNCPSKKNSSSDVNETSGDGGVAATEKMCIEFNHGELYTFFDQLEQLQSQLDGLSGQT